MPMAMRTPMQRSTPRGGRAGAGGSRGAPLGRWEPMLWDIFQELEIQNLRSRSNLADTEAQLHRHIPDRDDCIVCRMPEATAAPRFGCAAVALPQAGAPSADGALPFLSATAGLLLLSGLFRLQHGALAAGPENLYAVCFDNVRRAARVGACRCGCGAVLSRGARRRVHAGRRWSHLDLAAAAGE